MIRVIVIDGVSKKLYELDIPPSHTAIEEEIGTRFWIRRRLPWLSGRCVLFHAEGSIKGYEDFSLFDVSYMGSGLVCSVDAYGDLGSTPLPVADVAKHVTFLEAKHGIQK